MNFIGHPYITWRLWPEFNRCHLIGSFLPDIVPFVTTTVFSFEEIHEGGETLYQYLSQHNPKAIGISLAMLSHGIKYGADKYSQMLESRYQDKHDQIVNLIRDATPNISAKTASRSRFHNYLWSGIDVQILKNETGFMNHYRQLIKEIDLSETAEILAACFHKDESVITEVLSAFYPLIANPFETVEDLATVWRFAARGLPEKDEVNLEKITELFELIAKVVQDDWRQITDQIVTNVKNNFYDNGYL